MGDRHMRAVLRRLPSILVLLPLAFGLCPVRADDAEAVKEKLFQAKKDYGAEVQKFKKAITDLLDKREENARNKGDKKVLDQIKAERDAFEKTGEMPQIVPSSIREPLRSARIKLNTAYSLAVKDLVRLKMDDAASATEKEQQEFLSSALAFGKKTFLVTLKHYDVKVLNDWFTNNGATADDHSVMHKWNGQPVPHSIAMVPPDSGTAQVKYPLGGKWSMFSATVGVPRISENSKEPESALTFEILGDGKSLWKSESVTKMDTFQKYTVLVEKVKVLTLQVHCAGVHNWAHAVWLEPILVE
jgi:dsDNA-binding SOS-regulon protein